MKNCAVFSIYIFHATVYNNNISTLQKCKIKRDIGVHFYFRYGELGHQVNCYIERSMC